MVHLLHHLYRVDAPEYISAVLTSYKPKISQRSYSSCHKFRDAVLKERFYVPIILVLKALRVYTSLQHYPNYLLALQIHGNS